MKTLITSNDAPPANNHPVADTDLHQFCVDQQARYEQWLGRIGCSNTSKGTHEAVKASRYAKIVRHDGQTSSVCFIDLTNGNIVKGSWKGPVKNGVRGNIFAEDRGASCMDGTGPKYLR